MESEFKWPFPPANPPPAIILNVQAIKIIGFLLRQLNARDIYSKGKCRERRQVRGGWTSPSAVGLLDYSIFFLSSSSFFAQDNLSNTSR